MSSKAEGGPGLSESDALLQAFDKMAAFHREEAARRVAADTHATSTASTADIATQNSTGCSVAVVASAPRKKAKGSPRVPSKKELKRRRVEAEGRAIMPAWLEEKDPMLEGILEAMRRDDSA